MIPIVATLINTAQNSVEALKERISDVRIGPIVCGRDESILFSLDGKPMQGILRGRNRDLMLCGKLNKDRAVACRVLLDGDAKLT